MAFIKIEHIDTGEVYFLPRPTIYQALLADFDAIGDRANAYLKRKRIRADVWRVDYATELLAAYEIEYIAKAISPEKFKCTFFAPKIGFYQTAFMCAGDRTLELQACNDENEPEKASWKISFPLVEF